MNTDTIAISKELYPAPVVLKAAYAFLNSTYIHIDESPDKWLVHLRPKDGSHSLGVLVGEFENELISQAVRFVVLTRTSNLREILLARAMSSTMVITDSSTPDEDSRSGDISDYELEEILQNWFDAYGR